MEFIEFSKIWNEQPVVIPDTNAILDLYRYSPSTSQHVLKLLNRISDYIWIPHQVKEEYLIQYMHVISIEKRKYSELTNQISKVIQKSRENVSNHFKSYRGDEHPKINQLVDIVEAKLSEIENEAKRFHDEIKEEVQKHDFMFDTGNVKLFMDLMGEKEQIGHEFTYREKIDLYVEGDSRYLRKIPPGYMDEVKDKDDITKTKKFGDLLIWKQLLSHAELNEKPIIFITNDNKEDWWVLENKRPIEARPELHEEFKSYSEQAFIMISLREFINYIEQIFDIQNIVAYFELNGARLMENMVAQIGWQKKLNLSNILLQNSDFCNCFEKLTNVEINSIIEDEIYLSSAQYSRDTDMVKLAGSFSLTLEITSIEYEFFKSDGEVKVEGFVEVTFELTNHKQNEIKPETVNIIFSGYNIAAYTERLLNIV